MSGGTLIEAEWKRDHYLLCLLNTDNTTPLIYTYTLENSEELQCLVEQCLKTAETLRDFQNLGSLELIYFRLGHTI